MKGIYEPLGITVADDVETESAPRTYTAKQIAEKLGIYFIAGNPHPQAIACILNEDLFVSDAHKNVVTMDYGDHISVSVRYDEYNGYHEAKANMRELLVAKGNAARIPGINTGAPERAAQHAHRSGTHDR